MIELKLLNDDIGGERKSEGDITTDVYTGMLVPIPIPLSKQNSESP